VCDVIEAAEPVIYRLDGRVRCLDHHARRRDRHQRHSRCCDTCCISKLLATT